MPKQQKPSVPGNAKSKKPWSVRGQRESRKLAIDTWIGTSGGGGTMGGGQGGELGPQGGVGFMGTQPVSSPHVAVSRPRKVVPWLLLIKGVGDGQGKGES